MDILYKLGGVEKRRGWIVGSVMSTVREGWIVLDSERFSVYIAHPSEIEEK